MVLAEPSISAALRAVCNGSRRWKCAIETAIEVAVLKILYIGRHAGHRVHWVDPSSDRLWHGGRPCTRVFPERLLLPVNPMFYGGLPRCIHVNEYTQPNFEASEIKAARLLHSSFSSLQYVGYCVLVSPILSYVTLKTNLI